MSCQRLKSLIYIYAIYGKLSREAVIIWLVANLFAKVAEKSFQGDGHSWRVPVC